LAARSKSSIPSASPIPQCAFVCPGSDFLRVFLRQFFEFIILADSLGKLIDRDAFV